MNLGLRQASLESSAITCQEQGGELPFWNDTTHDLAETTLSPDLNRMYSLTHRSYR